MLKKIYLKKNEERRVKQGHPWVFSNEIDTAKSPFKDFMPGECVSIFSARNEALGSGYINPHTLLSIRIYSNQTDNPLTQDMLSSRLEAALALRTIYFDKPYYRLCFGEADLLPGIIIDRFNDILVLQLTTQGAWQLKDALKDALIALLDPKGILLKNEQANLALEGLTPSTEIIHGDVPQEILIEENGVLFHVPIAGGQKTGWFYDQRNNRLQLKNFVKGKSVLDVFAYLGSFGIYAGHYGAASVSFIESSKFACDYIQKNIAANNFSATTDVINEDAFTALKTFKDQGKQFDVVLVDPPAFIKRKKDFAEGFLAYQRINDLALACLKDQGILVSSSCSMHLSAGDLEAAIVKGNKQRAALKILNMAYQAPDHPWHPAIPETLYLKSIFLNKIKY